MLPTFTNANFLCQIKFELDFRIYESLWRPWTQVAVKFSLFTSANAAWRVQSSNAGMSIHLSISMWVIENLFRVTEVHYSVWKFPCRVEQILARRNGSLWEVLVPRELSGGNHGALQWKSAKSIPTRYEYLNNWLN